MPDFPESFHCGYRPVQARGEQPVKLRIGSEKVDETRTGLIEGADGRTRCAWHGGDALYQAYHDTEWGRPVADDRRLFEKICLEGFQSGLSWLTILRKRENFPEAFDG